MKAVTLGKKTFNLTLMSLNIQQERGLRIQTVETQLCDTASQFCISGGR